jgi:hypothetical protein
MKKLSIIALFFPLLFLSACSSKSQTTYTQSQENKSQVPVACTAEAKICPDGSAVGRGGSNCDFTPCPEVATSTNLIYQNNQYGFTLNLTKTWNGYSASSSVIAYGNKVVIRFPGWTAKNTHEDIPILIYPLATWQKWEKTNFAGYPTAAPIGPTERGRNNVYVFATAPRYNFDFQPGFEEVEKIITTLKTVNLGK